MGSGYQNVSPSAVVCKEERGVYVGLDGSQSQYGGGPVVGSGYQNVMPSEAVRDGKGTYGRLDGSQVQYGSSGIIAADSGAYNVVVEMGRRGQPPNRPVAAAAAAFSDNDSVLPADWPQYDTVDPDSLYEPVERPSRNQPKPTTIKMDGYVADLGSDGSPSFGESKL